MAARDDAPEVAGGAMGGTGAADRLRDDAEDDDGERRKAGGEAPADDGLNASLDESLLDRSLPVESDAPGAGGGREEAEEAEEQKERPSVEPVRADGLAAPAGPSAPLSPSSKLRSGRSTGTERSAAFSDLRRKLAASRTAAAAAEDKRKKPTPAVEAAGRTTAATTAPEAGGTSAEASRSAKAARAGPRWERVARMHRARSSRDPSPASAATPEAGLRGRAVEEEEPRTTSKPRLKTSVATEGAAVESRVKESGRDVDALESASDSREARDGAESEQVAPDEGGRRISEAPRRATSPSPSGGTDGGADEGSATSGAVASTASSGATAGRSAGDPIPSKPTPEAMPRATSPSRTGEIPSAATEGADCGAAGPREDAEDDENSRAVRVSVMCRSNTSSWEMIGRSKDDEAPRGSVWDSREADSREANGAKSDAVAPDEGECHMLEAPSQARRRLLVSEEGSSEPTERAEGTAVIRPTEEQVESDDEECRTTEAPMQAMSPLPSEWHSSELTAREEETAARKPTEELDMTNLLDEEDRHMMEALLRVTSLSPSNGTFSKPTTEANDGGGGEGPTARLNDKDRHTMEALLRVTSLSPTNKAPMEPALKTEEVQCARRAEEGVDATIFPTSNMGRVTGDEARDDADAILAEAGRRSLFDSDSDDGSCWDNAEIEEAKSPTALVPPQETPGGALGDDARDDTDARDDADSISARVDCSNNDKEGDNIFHRDSGDGPCREDGPDEVESQATIRAQMQRMPSTTGDEAGSYADATSAELDCPNNEKVGDGDGDGGSDVSRGENVDPDEATPRSERYERLLDESRESVEDLDRVLARVENFVLPHIIQKVKARTERCRGEEDARLRRRLARIENFLLPSIIQQVKGSRRWCRSAVSEECRRRRTGQDRTGEPRCDPRRIALASRRCARWSEELRANSEGFEFSEEGRP